MPALPSADDPCDVLVTPSSDPVRRFSRFARVERGGSIFVFPAQSDGGAQLERWAGSGLGLMEYKVTSCETAVVVWVPGFGNHEEVERRLSVAAAGPARESFEFKGLYNEVFVEACAQRRIDPQCEQELREFAAARCKSEGSPKLGDRAFCELVRNYLRSAAP